MKYCARYAMQYYLGILLAMCSLTVHGVVLLNNDSSTPVIHVGVLLDLDNSSKTDSKEGYNNAVEQIFKIAFADIQTRTDLLTGYRIQMHVHHSMYYDGRQAAVAMMKLLMLGEPKVAVLGPFNIDSLITTAQIAPVFHTIQLSIASNSDTTLFPTLYKVLEGSYLLNHFRIKLMKHFGWTRAASIVGREDLNDKQFNREFHYLMRENNITLVTTAFVEEMNSISNMLTTIKNSDVRIIFGSFPLWSYAMRWTLSEIMCEAFKQGLYGQRYVWILTGEITTRNWQHDTKDCTLEQVQIVANGHFGLSLDLRQNMSSSPELTITGMTPEEVLAILNVVTTVKFKEGSTSAFFDTALALALGLNNSIKHLHGQGMSLSNYSYSEQYLAAIMQGMDEVAFVGLTGPVSFDKFHNRIGNVYIKQHFASSSRDIVSYDGINESLHWFVPHNSIWKDNFIPADSALKTHQQKTIPKSLYVSLCVLAGVGIIVTIACCAFNVDCRKNRIVKMSSPNINSIILIGCLLLYVFIIIKTAASATKAICTVQLFCFWIGFATTFGSMFSKTWRVYRIFTNKKMERNMSIRDKHLLVIIGIVVTMETILLTVWECLSPHRVTRQQLDREIIITNSGDEILFFYPVCESDHSNHFIWTLRIMNGTLIAFGAFLAWESRNVHIDALNDSKTIGICVYNVVILSAVELLLSLILRDKPVELLGVTSVCLFAGTFVSEMLIFLPKMLAVYRNPTATPQTAVKTIETTQTEHGNTAL